MRNWLIKFGFCMACLAAPLWAHALSPKDIAPLGGDDFDAKAEVLDKLIAAGDAASQRLLAALADDRVMVLDSGRIVIRQGDTDIDALTAQPVPPSQTRGKNSADTAQPIMLSNVLRARVAVANAAWQLQSPERAVRARAIDTLLDAPNQNFKMQVAQARAHEPDRDLRAKLDQLWAMMALHDFDPAKRRDAIALLADSDDPRMRELLLPLVAKKPDGTYREPDASVRAAAQAGLRDLDSAQRTSEWLGTLFAGLSLGSVLLLAALGLAITYGLIGVINMAHGEFLMIGAYATYVVQMLFRRYLPSAFDAYLVAAVPVAFLGAAMVGLVLERTVLRLLYGRPLETLLSTFGLSLMMMQITRMLFGAQNVDVANPSWMGGGWHVLPSLTLPYNRIVILIFSLAVVALTWAVLNLTRLGLFIRAVTQNRTMAACVGVRTGRTDSYAFAFGAGIAGLGGCALSQIGNVGPSLGQSYIIDSFMAVVLGGVGQLAGTIAGAFGLGVLNKLLEPAWGAVPAKIAVLMAIILFIQKRPQGLFALKGRSAEA